MEVVGVVTASVTGLLVIIFGGRELVGLARGHALALQERVG